MLFVVLLLFDIVYYVYLVVWSYFIVEVFDWLFGDIGLLLVLVGFGYVFV